MKLVTQFPLVPDGWTVLADDQYDSTVAQFEGGYRQTSDGTEILVWSGTPQLYHIDDNGNTVYGSDPNYKTYSGRCFDVPDSSVGHVDDAFDFLIEWVPQQPVADQNGDSSSDGDTTEEFFARSEHEIMTTIKSLILHRND